MVKERKEEIVSNVKASYDYLIKNNNNPYEPITMFDVVSYYTNNYDNLEIIGGDWIRENIPELKELPS